MALLIIGLGALLFLAPVVPQKIHYYYCPDCLGGLFLPPSLMCL